MTLAERKAIGRHPLPADTTTTIRPLEEVLAQLNVRCRPPVEKVEERLAELWALDIFLIAGPGDVEVGNLERARESFSRMNRLKGSRGGASHPSSHSPSPSLFRSPSLAHGRTHTRHTHGREKAILK